MEQVRNKKVVIIIAFKDFRDAEYFITKEILDRVGIKVETASNKTGVAIGADGGEINVDLSLSDISVADFDGVVFVGGPGCLKNLDNESSYSLIKEVVAQNKVLASICISPIILAKSGVLKGKKATVWSSNLEKKPVKILKENGVLYRVDSVVVDGKIITANGPLSTYKFGEAIVEVLTGE
jgi:protease I